MPDDDEIQRVARAVQQTNSKLYEQISVIKQFVSNVSHEFKTPLMTLQSTLELARKTNAYQTAVEASIDTVGMMNRLLETMIALTMLEKQDLPLTKCVLAEIVNPLLLMLQHKYPDITFDHQIPSTLKIVTHQGSVERILTNLLDNAAKFSPAGGTVMLSADTHGIRIEDQGVGIAPDQLSSIWQPFWQADTARSDESFGLGLALVKQLVQKLHRSIQVTSELGK